MTESMRCPYDNELLESKACPERATGLPPLLLSEVPSLVGDHAGSEQVQGGGALRSRQGRIERAEVTDDLLLIRGNARRLPLADESVQCIVTSPPYWGLRKYAGEQELIWGGKQHTHEWGDEQKSGQRQRNGAPGGIHEERETNKLAENIVLNPATGATCIRCGAWRGAFGLEPTVEMYVAHTVEILRECRRVLRSDGVLFWNIGDSYAGSWGNAGNRPELDHQEGHQREKNTEYLAGGGRDTFRDRPPGSYPQNGLKPKDLCLIPARVALAAQADGWWVRSVIIWAKPNPMPESCRDRPTDAYEQILMLTKSARYFSDFFAVREPSITGDTRKPYCPGQVDARGDGHDRGGGQETERDGSSRNLRNVSDVPHAADARLRLRVRDCVRVASPPESPHGDRRGRQRTHRDSVLALPRVGRLGRALRHVPRRVAPPLHPRGHQREGRVRPSHHRR